MTFTSSRRARLSALPVWTALLLLLSWPLFAQDEGREDDPTLIIDDKEFTDLVRIAFPEPEMAGTMQSPLRAAGEELGRTLRDDLELAGIFALQGPTELSVLNLVGNPELDFEQYRSLGNEVLLEVKLQTEADRLVLEGRLFDLGSGQSIAGKRYRGTADQARRMAHRFADEIYRQFTGQLGIAQTTIAFQSDRTGHQELFLMDYDGYRQRRITGHLSTSGYASWSPTGDAIAYMSYFAGSPALYFADLSNNQKRPIYDQGTMNISPSFSPDGKLVAFAHSAGSNVDIYLCERLCTTPRRLTNSRAIDTNPAWNPNGRQLAFTSDRSGRPNIYVMDLNGDNLRRVSYDGDYNEGATWHPEGGRLAYATRRNGVFQIAVTDVIGLETRVITGGRNGHEEPAYSPDGRRIAFTRKRGRDAQVFVMDENGENVRQLTTEGRNTSPDWGPIPRQ